MKQEKEWSLGEMDWIGFDLDHTLIRYKLHRINSLIYWAQMQFLRHEMSHKYDARITSVPFDPMFQERGLLFDKELGHLLKLDAERRVVRATHGMRQLSEDEIAKAYPPEVLAGFDGQRSPDRSDRFWPLITFFEVPAAYLLSVLVPYVDEADKVAEGRYKRLFNDLIGGYGYNFNEYDKGWYFPILKGDADMSKHIGNYIYKRDEVVEWLKSLRAAGKRLFVVTNSRYDYTNLLGTYAFGENWRELFDFVSVHAHKGEFFTEQAKYKSTEDENYTEVRELRDDEDIELNGVFAHGNYKQLHRLISRDVAARCGGRAPRVVYFGDHVRTDVRACADHTEWLPVAVVEELEPFAIEDQRFDGKTKAQVSTHDRKLHSLVRKAHNRRKRAALGQLEHEHSSSCDEKKEHDAGSDDRSKRRRTGAATAVSGGGVDAHEQHVLDYKQEDGHFIAHDDDGNDHETYRVLPKESAHAWGSFFSCAHKPTFWNKYIQRFSALVVPDVAILAHVPLTHRFRYEAGEPSCYLVQPK
eukprot:TRINITY_DN66705_c3_g1_i1.p2 TRINITY_DN66705_c3_g1~~TRINITY_DN66705_c3_g1_i1.p2  ORF type:complete len:535 (+),score=252.86 TRINITY_DN66705_c3_g1_i1:25-1605(+)